MNYPIQLRIKDNRYVYTKTNDREVFRMLAMGGCNLYCVFKDGEGLVVPPNKVGFYIDLGYSSFFSDYADSFVAIKLSRNFLRKLGYTSNYYTANAEFDPINSCLVIDKYTLD